MMAHIPVMLDEVVKYLAPVDGDAILDGTFGGGGYAQAILAKADCDLLAVDRDPDALARMRAMAADAPRLKPIPGQFGDMETLARDAGFDAVDGVVLDLGVSSFQLDEAERGFSFMRDGPLDMRMGGDGPSAADVVNHAPAASLISVIAKLGEEPKARRIANAIVARRGDAVFERTLDLADTIETALGGRRGAKTHPATRVFQALRMFVNDELGELARGLRAAERLLRAGGRLVVVTFHSLEDRIVKNFLRDRAGLAGGGSRHAPERADGPPASFELLARRAIAVSDEEATSNPRARSSKLRAARRTNAPAFPMGVAEDFGLPPLSIAEASS
ncbi:MAG: 16S rRNA (cytosine(1402)-N(4))-methyltransferase RsmH [Pseudomonadota bacterium]